MNIRKNKILYGILGVILLLIILAPKLTNIFSSGVKENKSGRTDQQLAVKAYRVKSARLDDKIFATGSLLANEEIELRSEVSGKVTRIYFQEGSKVHKGALLVKINDSELQAQLLREEYRLKLAQEKELRQRQLLQQQLVAQEVYDGALNEVKIVEAGKQLIQAQIEKTELRAPFDGTIGLKFVSEGSYISPATKMATLQNTNPIKIDFSIPEKYAANILKGAKVFFRVQGMKDVLQAQVFARELKIDPATRTMMVRALAPNPTGRLIPGAFAEIELVLETIPDAISIPAQALIPEASDQKVFLYRSGVVQAQVVQTGIRTATEVQITAGLKIGDTLITSGILQIRPSMKVQLSEIQ